MSGPVCAVRCIVIVGSLNDKTCLIYFHTTRALVQETFLPSTSSYRIHWPCLPEKLLLHISLPAHVDVPSPPPIFSAAKGLLSVRMAHTLEFLNLLSLVHDSVLVSGLCLLCSNCWGPLPSCCQSRSCLANVRVAGFQL